MKQNSHIHIGTSGWHYGHWQGPFYPEHLAKADFLAFYQKHFHTVEINNSFYRPLRRRPLGAGGTKFRRDLFLQSKEAAISPISKKLKVSEQSLKLFFDRVAILENRLGPILFQLPPHWHFNPERLQAFLRDLPAGYRYTFEFRDQSWHNQDTYQLLTHYGAAFCIYEFGGVLYSRVVTAEFIYIRLHGPGGPYQGSYDTKTLGDWATTISTWASQGKEVFCYFDNDEAGYAAQNALSLKKMLSQE